MNVETLRYYERRGLLPEPTEAPNGHRRYDEESVRFLRAIKEAQAVGFTLSEIEGYLRAARRGSGAALRALRVRMATKIGEIDARIAALRRMREELARVVGCACDSLDRCTCGAGHLARRGHRKGVCQADPAARHERRERRQHASADIARRRRPPVAGRAARGAGTVRRATGPAARTGGVPCRSVAGEAAGRSCPRSSGGTACYLEALKDGTQLVVSLVRARPLRPAPAPRRARAGPRDLGGAPPS